MAYVQWNICDYIRTRTLVACVSHFTVNIPNKTSRKKNAFFVGSTNPSLQIYARKGTLCVHPGRREF